MRVVLRRRFAQRGCTREDETDCRAAPGRGLDFHRTAGLPRGAEHLCETKTGAFAGGFGREKGLEGAIGNVLRHAHATIGHGEFDAFGVIGGIANADRDVSAVGHRIACVDHEIEDGKLKLIGVGLDPSRAWLEVEVEFSLWVD